MARKYMSDKRKRDFKRLVEKTKRNAYNSGTPWSDDDVAYVMNNVDQRSTFDIAMNTGRSYYSVQTAKSHIKFAMDHQAVLWNVVSIKDKRKASNG